MITADTITDQQIREMVEAGSISETTFEYATCRHEFVARDVIAGARARCAELLNAREHATKIETETRGAPVANQELHLYHRWSCSCGEVGAWGHSLWARHSIECAEISARAHVARAVAS